MPLIVNSVVLIIFDFLLVVPCGIVTTSYRFVICTSSAIRYIDNTSVALVQH